MKPPVLTSTEVRPLACSTSRACASGRSCRHAVYAPSLRAMAGPPFLSGRGPAAGRAAEGPAGGRPSALELVRELGELLPAGHLRGELLEADLGALLVEHPLAQLQDDEVVAHQVGVVRVVGDEDDAEARVARRGGVLEDHP